MLSTRWHDAFTYAQAKTELSLPRWFVRPYSSVRFIGDSRGAVEFGAGMGPQYLSEGRIVPDSLCGLSYTKGFGRMLARGTHGAFAETNNDGIFVSRFSNDTLLYSQNRTGYTLRAAEAARALHAQLNWNWNATVDV